MSNALPILRWAGSKRKSIGLLKEALPITFARYIEVFAGSACLFLSVKPRSAIISDNNIDLISFYQTITSEVESVYERFISIPREKEIYYKVREQIKEMERGTIAWAAYFLFLNRNCFNGIYRTNLKGEFNVPFSGERVSAYPSFEQVSNCVERFKSAKIICDDFEAVCRDNVMKDDLVYLDPPYYIPQKRTFREYSSKPFDESDFARLIETLSLIDSRGGNFILSYPSCEIMDLISKNWTSTSSTVFRSVAGNPKARGEAKELLIRNF